jgi:hypothetical protein
VALIDVMKAIEMFKAKVPSGARREHGGFTALSAGR